MVRAGQTTAAQTTGRQAEIPAILLHHDVAGDFGSAEERVLGLVDGKALRNPLRKLRVVLGSLLFGISLSIATALQIAGINISNDLVNMLPFIAIIVALMAFGRRSYLPPALCIPY